MKLVVSGLSILTVRSCISTAPFKVVASSRVPPSIEAHWLPPRTPVAGRTGEEARHSQAAAQTSALGAKLPPAKLIPVALDQQFAARRAIRARANRVVHVAGIDIVEPVAECDRARPGER